MNPIQSARLCLPPCAILAEIRVRSRAICLCRAGEEKETVSSCGYAASISDATKLATLPWLSVFNFAALSLVAHMSGGGGILRISEPRCVLRSSFGCSRAFFLDVSRFVFSRCHHQPPVCSALAKVAIAASPCGYGGLVSL
jgi:hypothetical protein